MTLDQIHIHTAVARLSTCGPWSMLDLTAMSFNVVMLLVRDATHA